MSEPASELAANCNLIRSTSSVCPVCLEVIPARIISEGREVHMLKECPEHGPYKTYVWPDSDHYRWVNSFRMPLVRPEQTIQSLGGCPDDCGLCSAHQRRPTLVEIELTEKCNLRCPVCFMSAEEIQARQRRTGPRRPGWILPIDSCPNRPDNAIQLTVANRPCGPTCR